jgi:hypothetical protein
MKKITVFVFAIVFCFSLMAQNAKTATASLVTAYKLNDKQALRMEKIQDNKVLNLSQIEKYKTSNPSLYLQKRQAISEGTESSVSRLLNKEQMLIFREKKAQIRLARAKKSEELRNSKINDLEKELTLLELEDQF